jgi:hypothetical protein
MGYIFIFQVKPFEVRMLDIVLTALGSFLFLLIAAAHIVFSYDWKWHLRRSDCKKINMIPGPKPVPFFGNIFLLNVAEGGKCYPTTLMH